MRNDFTDLGVVVPLSEGEKLICLRCSYVKVISLYLRRLALLD